MHGAEVRLGRTRSVLGRHGRRPRRRARLRWRCPGGRSTSGSTLRWSSAASGRARRGARRLAAIRVPTRAPLGVRLRERDVRAALAERAGRRADALRHLRHGLADLHEWQSSFGSLDLQTMVTGHGRRLAVRGLRVAVASRIARGAVRVVGARADAGQPGAAGAGARRRGGAGRPPGAALAGDRRGPVARRARRARPSCGSGCASGPGSTAARASTTTPPPSPTSRRGPAARPGAGRARRDRRARCRRSWSPTSRRPSSTSGRGRRSTP